MKQQFFDAEIVQILEEGPATKRFFFKMPHLEKFDFKPGQFVMIDTPVESKISYRSYSIASAPGDDNIFELLIVLNPTGLATPYMFDNYRTGSIVPVAGPLGKFVLPAAIENDICFIATGTGIAPLRSMLRHILDKGIPHKNLYMVFGNRKTDDILYRKEMEELSATYPEFSFIPVLSRESLETWKGKHGYVHAVYEEIFADKRPASFYLCGWSAMLKEARERLSAMGYTKDQIKFELYD